MPAYGTYPNSRSVYPGHNAIVIGQPAIPAGGPSGTSSDQAEAVTDNYKSIPAVIAPAAGGQGVGYPQRQVTWQVDYGTAPSAISWELEGAIDDVNGDYKQVDTATSTSNFSQTIASNYRFFRLVATGITGSPTCVAKITCL